MSRAAPPRSRHASAWVSSRSRRSRTMCAALIAEDNMVVTEHVEHWEWPTGERASLPFVSIHEARDGKLVRWWDYWDLATLMSAAPAWWVEHIMNESVRIGLREA